VPTLALNNSLQSKPLSIAQQPKVFDSSLPRVDQPQSADLGRQQLRLSANPLSNPAGVKGSNGGFDSSLFNKHLPAINRWNP